MPVMPAPTTATSKSTSTSGSRGPIVLPFVPTGKYIRASAPDPEVALLGDDYHAPTRIHEALLVVAQHRAAVAEVPVGPEPHPGQVGEADLGDTVVRGLGC